MQEPKLTEEELVGLSEEEKQQKIAELEQRKKEYWEERYRRNVYEFGDYDGPEDPEMSPGVAMADKRIKEIIAQLKKEELGK